jgi:hypothetical protein
MRWIVFRPVSIVREALLHNYPRDAQTLAIAGEEIQHRGEQVNLVMASHETRPLHSNRFECDGVDKGDKGDGTGSDFFCAAREVNAHQNAGCRLDQSNNTLLRLTVAG